MSRNGGGSSSNANSFMSTAQAAKFLFVSRPHVVTLIDQGKLEIHHKTANNCFVTKVSVLAYQTTLQEAMMAYHASNSDEK
ncbi:helix-turn-helix domain-containing protein [Paraburkholderia sp. BL17N1]|uniref:helix-turn-helix domain-containing protein n=1 Tax=Paraburkholderia sp. BL17N1 TaxID=1938798 RepID=UPI0011C4550F|nr:helix-turn-helix domain-containing protein [Paraburkholderia sp. BL17N1]